MSIQLEASWLEVLSKEFESAYFLSLRDFLKREKQGSKPVYPPGPEIFAALDQTPFNQVKVVIIGQDPYHGPGQANGLCFSVKDGVPHPPSLQNIFKELESDLGKPVPASGDLSSWAHQGVLLLNATLTVRQGEAGSHQNRGWEQFTDAIIDTLNEKREHLVYMLWGAYARNKGRRINRNRNLVLECGHPSPLSANRGNWFGNRHFSRCNQYLISQGIEPVNW